MANHTGLPQGIPCLRRHRKHCDAVASAKPLVYGSVRCSVEVRVFVVVLSAQLLFVFVPAYAITYMVSVFDMWALF
jgi:hypothetical protein